MTIKLQRQFQMTIYPPQYLQTAPINTNLTPTSSPNLSQELALSNPPSAGSFSFTSPVGETITIENPFTLIFNIQRKALASVNTGNFQIYNLSQTTRNSLYKDYTNLLCIRRITLRAGYQSQGVLPVIFDGNIKWCTSYRKQGSTNFVTEIEAYDWAFPVVNAHTTKNFSGLTQKNKVIQQLVSDICAMGPSGQQVSPGYIHNYLDTNNNPITQYNRSLSGYSWRLLQDETENACFIDNGQLNILADDDCFAGTFVQISSATGLLGAPKRSETYVLVELLFEPSLLVGQQVNLLTVSEAQFNGNYKIYGINHFGIISDSVNGQCQSNVSLFSFQKNAQLIAQSQGTQ